MIINYFEASYSPISRTTSFGRTFMDCMNSVRPSPSLSALVEVISWTVNSAMMDRPNKKLRLILWAWSLQHQRGVELAVHAN